MAEFTYPPLIQRIEGKVGEVIFENSPPRPVGSELAGEVLSGQIRPYSKSTGFSWSWALERTNSDYFLFKKADSGINPSFVGAAIMGTLQSDVGHESDGNGYHK